MCKVADIILELQTGLSEAHSGSLRSIRSSRSIHSVASKRSNVFAEVATLKAKLKFIDAESKAKLELDRVVTQKRIEMAQAEADALDDNSSEALSEGKGLEGLDIPEIIKHKYVQQYVQNNTPTRFGQVTTKIEPTSKVKHEPNDQNHLAELSLNPYAGVFLPSQSQQNNSNQVLPSTNPVKVPLQRMVFWS